MPIKLRFNSELVASFHECQHCSPWPQCKPRVVAGCDAVRKIHGSRGSVEDGMRMIITCFARVPQRCTSRLYMHFLLIFQELRPISKTRNQLFDINDWPLTCRTAIPGERSPRVTTPTSPLVFRKHQCHTTSLVGTISHVDEVRLGVAMSIMAPKGRKHLCADALFSLVRQSFANITDNGADEVEIPLRDALMSAFALFSLKSPSLPDNSVIFQRL